MYKLSRTHPPDKQVLKDISLSLPARREDRRAGPQRRRQVDAAADHGRAATPSSAARRSSLPAPPSGCSSRSPSSTRPRTCAATSRTASREPRDLLDRFNELAANYSDDTADEFARLQERIDAADAWNLDTQLDTAMDALRLPAGRRRRHHAVRRRAPPRRAVPAAAERARPAAARRADQPPRRRVGRAGSSGTSRSTRAPIVAVTHDRYFLDNVAGWILELDRGRGIPFKGNYSSWLEQKQARLAQEEKPETARQRTIARELEWVRENPQGPAQEGQGAPEQLRAPAGRGAQRQARPGPDPHPGRAAARRRGDRGRAAAQGLRRPAADRGPLVHAAARRASSA